MKKLYIVSVLLPFLFSAQNKIFKYTDIHNHIALKNYLRAVADPQKVFEQRKELAYENWYSPANNFNPNEKSNEENYFQADFSNLAESGFRIICNSVTPIEQNGIFSSVKRGVNSSFETHISTERLAKTYETTPIEDFFSEMEFLKSQKPLLAQPNNTFYFQMVNNKEELLQCLAQKKTAIITTIEGGHVFYGDKVKYNKGFLNPNCSQEEENEILDNVKRIKNYETRILSIGLCHLFVNKFGGHAKALDISANSQFNRVVLQNAISLVYGAPLLGKVLDTKIYEGLRDGDVTLKSFKNRIDKSDIGLKLVKALLDSSDNIHKKPILIDVKHMDIQTRKDYYALLESNPKYKNIPIIASHAAASGKNEKLATLTGSFPYYDDYSENRNPKKFYKKNWKDWIRNKAITDNDYPKEVEFLNPFSFNLFDEEIKKIYDSKGLIGIIFEQRTLGGYMLGYSWERKEKMEEKLKDYLSKETERSMYLHSEPFLRNLFYFAEHSGRKDSSAFDALSIGTDFDGFIDPINSCLFSASLPYFLENLEKFIPIYLDIEKGNQDLLYGLSPKLILQKVFNDNAERFILENL